MFGKVNQQGRGGRGGSNAKRPRVALYSHPNNIIGEETAIPPSTWSTSSATSSWNWREAAEKKWPPQDRATGTRPGKGRGGYSNRGIIDRKRTK